MDILRKMFQQTEKAADKDKGSTAKDEFRKPQWFEEAETDDELFDDDRKFAFQIFTSPLELQKQFEQQIQQIMEALNQFEDGDLSVDTNLKDEFLKPGFDKSIAKEFEKHKHLVDTDLDGEVIADDLHSLLQRLKTDEQELPHILPRNDGKKANKYLGKKNKLTDEEKIFGKIHGTLLDDETPKRPRIRSDVMVPITPPLMPRSGQQPFGGMFDETYKGPKMFRQSIITKTVRKPDGSTETTQIRQDSDGNKTTTITRTKDGKSETHTTYDGTEGSSSLIDGSRNSEKESYSDRNIYVSKNGYALPRNLW